MVNGNGGGAHKSLGASLTRLITGEVEKEEEVLQRCCCAGEQQQQQQLDFAD